jgi:hypothetical protein
MRDPKYMGAEMFIFRQIWMSECPFDVSCNVVDAFNKMHVCYMIHVERGIGGLKSKKNCNVDETIKCYETQVHVFVRILCPFDKLLHQRMMDLSQKTIGNNSDDIEAHG